MRVTALGDQRSGHYGELRGSGLEGLHKIQKKEENLLEVERLKDFKADTGWTFEQLAFGIGRSTLCVFNWFERRFRPNQESRELINRFLEKEELNEEKKGEPFPKEKPSGQ